MSVVILGGNECMVRKYKDLCQEYRCSAKVFAKMGGGLRNKLGKPDLLVLFTNTISHKMVTAAMHELKSQNTTIAHCHSSSMSALRQVLEKHAPEVGA